MDLNILHEQGRRYYVLVNGEVAEASYTEAADGTRRFDHTYVPGSMRGQGVAEKLVRHALDDTIRSGHRFVAVCSYVERFVELHPEYRPS